MLLRRKKMESKRIDENAQDLVRKSKHLKNRANSKVAQRNNIKVEDPRIKHKKIMDNPNTERQLMVQKGEDANQPRVNKKQQYHKHKCSSETPENQLSMYINHCPIITVLIKTMTVVDLFI